MDVIHSASQEASCTAVTPLLYRAEVNFASEETAFFFLFLSADILYLEPIPVNSEGSLLSLIVIHLRKKSQFMSRKEKDDMAGGVVEASRGNFLNKGTNSPYADMPPYQ